MLIFSSSWNLENGWGRAKKRGLQGRNRDKKDGANYSRNKNYRTKTYCTKVNESTNSEDGRIMRKLRLLSRKTDEDVITEICQQLQVLYYFFMITFGANIVKVFFKATIFLFFFFELNLLKV